MAPRLSPSAAEKLSSHFVSLRRQIHAHETSSQSRSSIPITIRQLEAVCPAFQSPFCPFRNLVLHPYSLPFLFPNPPPTPLSPTSKTNKDIPKSDNAYLRITRKTNPHLPRHRIPRRRSNPPLPSLNNARRHRHRWLLLLKPQLQRRPPSRDSKSGRRAAEEVASGLVNGAETIKERVCGWEGL